MTGLTWRGRKWGWGVFQKEKMTAPCSKVDICFWGVLGRCCNQDQEYNMHVCRGVLVFVCPDPNFLRSRATAQVATLLASLSLQDVWRSSQCTLLTALGHTGSGHLMVSPFLCCLHCTGRQDAYADCMLLCTCCTAATACASCHVQAAHAHVVSAVIPPVLDIILSISQQCSEDGKLL